MQTTYKTAADERAIREIDNLIEALHAWRTSVRECGYDKAWALTDHAVAARFAAKLFEVDELHELADFIDAEIRAEQPVEPHIFVEQAAYFNATRGVLA